MTGNANHGDYHSMKMWRMFLVNISMAVLVVIMLVYLGILIRNNQLIGEEIQARARSYFQHIVLARRWNAGYGGVYVEKKRGVESNPYLENPDISSIDGTLYTLKNPALMTREISKLAEDGGLFKFRITSLKPLNPGNGADEFEKRALEFFENGMHEYSENVADGEKTFFRYMGPLFVEAACLKCHAKQGYTIGQVRGGISVSFDVTEILGSLHRQRYIIIVLSTVTALLLIGMLYAIVRRLMRKVRDLYARIEAMSFTDELTGLSNRRYLFARLNAEYERAGRNSRPISFIMADLDHFKSINDRYGHQAGDVVLRDVSGVIKSELRKSDVVARYGGEEIAVILPDTARETGLAIAEKIRKKVEDRGVILSDGGVLKVTISAGVSGFIPRGETAEGVEKLVRSADDALYRAKHNGRNRCEVSEP